jgi:hypothetical protein
MLVGLSSFGIRENPPYSKILMHRLLSISTTIASASAGIPYTTVTLCSTSCASTSSTPTSGSDVLTKYSISIILVIAEVVICWWTIYGCLVVVLNGPHIDPIVIMGNIVPVISNRSHQHSFQCLMQLLEFLMRRFLELLEFGSRRNLLATSSVVKGIVTVALIEHGQKKLALIPTDIVEDLVRTIRSVCVF